MKSATARAAKVVATVMATTALLIPAGTAMASSPDGIIFANPASWEIAFKADSTLWAWGEGYTGNSITSEPLAAKPDMAPGTSPSIAALPVSQGTFQVVWQGLNGDLWSTGPTGPVDLGLGMMPGTSPSLTELTYGGWQAAFQANTGALWVTGSDGTGPVGDPMDPASSPSITAQPNGGYEVAYQSATHALDVTGNFQIGTDSPAGTMAAGTSPSITQESATAQGGYQVAWHGSDGTLWTAGLLDEAGRVGLAMAPGTSPSIAALTLLPSGALPFEIAFQSSTGALSVYGGLGSGSPGTAMAPGASPSIVWAYVNYIGPIGGPPVLPVPGYRIAYEGTNGTLWTANYYATYGQPESSTTDSGVPMDATTQPSIMTYFP